MRAMERVLITGAAGLVGGVVRRDLAGRYRNVRVTDAKPLGEAGPGEELLQADVRDFEAMLEATADCDAVVHFGSIPVEDSWDSIFEVNFRGTQNVVEAARRNGAKRILFASSNHAIGFYRRSRRIDHAVLPRPDSRYGLSKAFGEDLLSYYADNYAMQAFCMRIGTCNAANRPMDARQLSTWISWRDMAQLVRVGLEAPDLHFAIVYGCSRNSRGWWDNSVAEKLGYRPQDSADDWAAEILGRADPEPVPETAKLFQGGTFAAAEFEGDLTKL
jgi:uronate dehydrogenase